MNFYKKIFAVVAIFSLLNLYTAPAAHALSLDFGVTEGIASAILDIVSPGLEIAMEELHISGEGTEFLTELMNVTKAKNKDPQVDLYFNPTNPKVGEKITATAYASNFKDVTTDALYFTWYLKHENDADNTDWDKDGKIDMDDYKIEAMRIAANGGWSSSGTEYNGSADDDNDGVAELKNEATDGKNDKTNLPFGGLGVREPESGFRCYAKDYEDGLYYEIIPGNVSSENIPPESDNPDYGERGIYDFNVAGCEICGEGVTTATVKTCEEEYTITDTCSAMAIDNNLLWFGQRDTLLVKIPLARTPGCSVCVFCEDDTAANNGVCGVKTGEQVGEDDPGDYEGESSICTHLFPHAPHFTTGDGEFTDEEEEFWGTNPQDPDTNDDGINDEASVAGIGLDTFSWIYNKGDRVGLVVEGQSTISTKYFDGGYMVMWALPKNNFDVPGTECGLKNKQPYMVTIMDLPVTIPAANFDLEKCLKYNWVDPLDGTQPKKLDVELSYSPTNPRNNSSGKSGDLLIVNSSLVNSETNDNQIYYKWTIEQGSQLSLNNDNWTEISNDPAFRKAAGITYLEGLGLETLKMNLNLPELDDYLRITVNVEEFNQSNVAKKGNASTIIRINSGSNNGIIFKSNTSGSAICEDQTICTALNNQILTASLQGDFKNFAWLINGKAANFKQGGQDVVQGSKQGNTINFPIVGSVGDTYRISVTANNIETNESMTTERIIKIINPSMKLGVSSGASPKFRGTYTGLDGETVDDVSKNKYNSTGGDVTVVAQLNPSWMNPLPKVEWTVNGVTREETGTSITLSSSQYPTGSRVQISATADYMQSNAARKDLRTNWNVSQFSSAEVTMKDSISVTMGENPVVSQGKNKMLANIFSALPGQTIFLLRLLLTTLMFLFIPSLVLSFGRPSRS
ncbi:MAG: hypothetical protein OEV93_04160 [Candidatus Moranbacteria bacterium]|nr:hypothetical protein [Candidatus Moranbacteria bacterium]